MQARMVIFGMNVNDSLIYSEIENQSSIAYSPCLWIENQASPAYSSLYLSNFLSFHTLKNEMFRKRFLLNHAS